MTIYNLTFLNKLNSSLRVNLLINSQQF
uniref:Uncharacterized protein n=1 Tax=Heterorhabditis bacteriophora TaxID=37862 RepID=A0A1I7WDL1_HETBA